MADEVSELLERLLDRPRWHLDALCREYPREMFFPGRGEPADPAKRVCARCLVQRECAAWALREDDGWLSGIWGGLSARERRAVRSTAA